MTHQLLPNFPAVTWVAVEIRGGLPNGTAQARGSKHCLIQFDKNYLLAGKSDTEVAFLLAHELAHCQYAHGASRYTFVDKNLFWEQEFLADKLALKATRYAGLGDMTRVGEPDLPFYLRSSQAASNTHPGGALRLQVLQGGSADGARLLVSAGQIFIVGASPP